MAILIIVTTPDGTITQKTVSKKPISIGRAENCTLEINDSLCSTNHCEIYLENNFAVIKDLNSTNGTYLNESIVSGARIFVKDEIRIGKTNIRLVEEKMNQDEL